MAIHFISVIICIVSVTVCIVHSQSVLSWAEKDSDSVGHDTGFMKSWLSIHEHHVPVSQLPPNRNHSTVRQQPRRNRMTTPLLHLTQIDPLPIREFHPHRSRIFGRTAPDEILHFGNVQSGDGRGESESFGKIERKTDFVGSDVGVGRDDGAAGVVDAFSHHVLSENTLFLFQQLPDPIRCTVRGSLRITRAIHKAIHRGLQIHPRGQRIRLSLILLFPNLSQFGMKLSLPMVAISIATVTQSILQIQLLLRQFVNRRERRPHPGVQFQHLAQIIILRMFHGHGPHDDRRSKPRRRHGHGA
mmetsp:Transcript_11591/g.25066  ORF Transcript_11591/g.25066 Transcript_11591/m.25066 type:complete len:301 (-) Transcript_11591:2934-3836(-)